MPEWLTHWLRVKVSKVPASLVEFFTTWHVFFLIFISLVVPFCCRPIPPYDLCEIYTPTTYSHASLVLSDTMELRRTTSYDDKDPDRSWSYERSDMVGHDRSKLEVDKWICIIAGGAHDAAHLLCVTSFNGIELCSRATEHGSMEDAYRVTSLSGVWWWLQWFPNYIRIRRDAIIMQFISQATDTSWLPRAMAKEYSVGLSCRPSPCDGRWCGHRRVFEVPETRVP